MTTIVLLILSIALLFFSYKYFFPNRANQFRPFDKQFYNREESSPYERNSSKEKGDDFEKFVLKLFDFESERFVLKEWRSDKFFDGIYPKSNHYPDFEIQLNTRNGFKVFAVECKYRSNWNQDGTITWAKNSQINNYENYSNQKDIPVFIVLGVGGIPKVPEEVYIFSMENVGFKALINCNYLQRFKRESASASLFYDAIYKRLK
ncbi:MAG: hypothetical protein ACRYFA_10610 [Janthinobacterium lividum]